MYWKKQLHLKINAGIKCWKDALKTTSSFLMNIILKSQKLLNYGRSDYLAWIGIKLEKHIKDQEN